MVNNNQQQEKPQDFELIELLFQKIASTGSDPAGQLDKSFEARFQSMINQMQSYLHSSIKDGFFPHRALGWFSSVLDTKLNNKVGIKKLHFRFEGASTLKVVAEKEDKTHVFIFTDNEGAQCKFTKDEWKDIKGNDFNNSDKGKLQIDVVKIIKSYGIRRGKQESDESIGPRQLYLYLNNDDVLEFKVRSSFGDIQIVQIERDESEGDFSDEIQQYLQGGDLSDGARERLLRDASEKGYTYFLVNIENDEKINSGKPSVSLEDFPFQEVTKKLDKSVYLENYIEKLANPDTEIDQVQDNLEKILTYIKEVHTNLNLQGNVYGIKAREADQHGFVAGIFDNFRYRDNAKLYLEQFAGRGYADIVLLVRGPNRAVDSVPILIELKTGTEGQVDPSDALEQAKDYIKGFRPNKMRILTNADNAIAVGLNLDDAEPFKTEVQPIKQPPAPLMEEFIKLAHRWNNQQISEEDFKQEITDLLSSEYHTFPANKETKDHYYFSRDILGQSILINKIGQDQDNIKKYIYSYGEYPLNWPQGTEYTLSKSPVTTLIFVQGNEGQENTAFIFHIRESNTKEFYADKKIPVLNIPGIGKVGNVIEIKMSLAKYRTSVSFEDLFEIKEINKYQPSNTDQYFAGGEFIEVPNSGNLKEKFDQVIISHGVASSSTQEDLLQDYRELFNREIANVIYYVKDLITNEARLQAVLSGLFSSYSDLKVQQSASAEPGTSAKIMIIPEFQVGKGGRVDMVVQAIGPSSQSTKEYIPVGTELKLKKEVKCLPEHVDELIIEQMIRYANGEALKTIADGTKMYFIGVVFCQKAKGKDSLFLTSDKFVSASIDHSSEEIIEDICVIPEHLYDCKKIVDEAYEIRPDKINDNIVFKLATCIKEIMEACEGKPYNGLEELKDNLPESAKNLVFASQICIKNVEYGRYLYSPNNDCMYHLNKCDMDRRYVFTWPSNGNSDQFKWKVELNGDNVYLKNVEYGRYLYSPNNDCMYHLNNCDRDRRYVFTWPSNGNSDKFKWKVEPNGDNVYLKNVEYGRYLYSPNSASTFQVDNNRRYVFTWPSNEEGGQFKWKIENCGSTRKRSSIRELNGYNQTVVDYQLILTEENSQQIASRISTIVEDVERHTFLNQSKNKLDLDSYLNNRGRSNAADSMRRDVCSELNASGRKNIILSGNNVCAITSGYETLDIENFPIQEVVVNDDANGKKSLRSTLDLHQLVKQVNRDLSIKPIPTIIKDKSDLLIKLSISATGLQQDVITVRLKDALINKWYKKLQIIFDNAPVEIDDGLGLKPSFFISDENFIEVTSQSIEEKNKLIVSKKAGQYTYLHDKYDLIVTNVFNADVEASELCIIRFKDFYKEPKMKTLTIKFTDKEILLTNEIDKINNSDSIDKLNNVSSIVDSQESSIHLEVSNSGDINAQGKLNRTLLHLASEAGEFDKVKLLLDRGANIEVQDKFGYTPIFLATQSGKWSIVKLLLDRGANIDAQDEKGQTLLHFAASGNNLDMVQFLLDRGANIEIQDKFAWTPILYAAQSGKWNVVKLLISNGAKFNNETTVQGTPLHFAVQEGNLDIIRFLLDEGADIESQDKDNKKPLHLAVEAGRLDILELLLDRGANINATDMDGQTPLHLAAKHHRLDVVKYLIEKGANTNAKDKDEKTPLELAIQENYADIVEFFKQTQLDKELLTAAEKGDLEKVRDSIIRGANVNAQDSQGWTPLFWAIQNNNFNIVELLLDNSADIKVKDNEAWTPLHWAVQLGSLDVVERLVERGADFNASTADGRTPLDIARDKGYDNVVNYLEEELSKEREKPVRRKRLHHHGDHNSHHLSRKLRSIDSSNQPEIVASSGARPSSWINDLFGWVKSSIGGLLGSRAALPEKTFTQSSISQISAPIDVNGTIMLLDLLIRKVTGQKYISTVGQSISPLEAQGYTLNITKEFEKVVEQAGLKSGVSMHRLNIDFVGMHKEITGKIMGGKFNEISGILKSYVEKACPDEEAGKLNPKKFDKFIAQFNKGLLNQSIEQILHNRDGRLEVDDAKQMSLEPQSYLSNASVHSHSKVSTCLSDIGVTKLGGNLNR